MDIHKPKPVRNWREFLTEIGTIVIGVCIALAAEQIVEAIHWHQKVALAGEQIRLELRQSLDHSVERIMVDDCIQHRLNDLEDRLLSTGASWTPVAPAGITGLQAGNVLPVPERAWSSVAWTAAVADTSVTHFDPDKLRLYTYLYASIETAQTLNQSEYEAVARLNVLAKPVKLSSDQIVELIQAIEAERARNRLMALIGSGRLGAWQHGGFDVAAARAWIAKTSTTYKACQAAHGRP